MSVCPGPRRGRGPARRHDAAVPGSRAVRDRRPLAPRLAGSEVAMSRGMERWGRVGAGLAGITLVLLSTGWIVRPSWTSGLFGVPLAGTLEAYGRVKGFEDL